MKMASICILTDDAILYIMHYLDTKDRIALAGTCQRMTQICINARTFRKLDLSKRLLSTTQRSVVNTFFKDRQLTQHIRELDVSNLRVLNWQMEDQLKEFIISICPHLETLHVLNCGMSLQRLHGILKEAHQLTALSWSLWDFTAEDIEFLVNRSKSSDGICLKNIKYLRLEMNKSKPHFQIAKYLVLSCCRDIEELEIYIWSKHRTYGTERHFPLQEDYMIPGIPQPSVENELQHLHSLVVVEYDCFYEEMLSDFVVSVARSKPSLTKWKKLWIPETIGGFRRHPSYLSLLLHEVQSHDFQSVEAIMAGWSHEVNEVKTLFAKIGDNTVKSLNICLPDCRNSVVELCDPFSRVAGRSLKFLRLFVHNLEEIPAEQHVFVHTLFSNCMNITELDLLYCSFEKDICEPLSKLKHLSKVQLSECAISSKYNENEVEISKADLSIFLENCKNIAHLDLRHCGFHEKPFSCRLMDYELLAKLRNLKSLTLDEISGIREWTFLKNILENCKFLTMLRIADMRYFKDHHIPVLMESAKFLKHLALDVNVPVMGSEVFWNLLSHAKNLERLCIRHYNHSFANVAAAVETIKSLPHLHVLHLHSCIGSTWREIFPPESQINLWSFYHEMRRMLEEKEPDCRFSFEIVTRNVNKLRCSLISTKALLLNKAELCDMSPILAIPRL